MSTINGDLLTCRHCGNVYLKERMQALVSYSLAIYYCQACYPQCKCAVKHCYNIVVTRSRYATRTSQLLCMSCETERRLANFYAGSSGSYLKHPRYIGVEIECFAPNGSGLSSSSIWSVSEDASLRTTLVNYHAEEHQSIPISGADAENHIIDRLDKMNRLSYRVNKTCGLHVHVDAHKLSIEEITNVWRFFARAESILVNLVSRARTSTAENMRYCKRLEPDIRDLKPQDLGYEIHKGSIDRYHALNVQALTKHGTLEFRLHQGTLSVEKVLSWASLCLSMVELGRLRALKKSALPAIPTRTNLNRLLDVLDIPTPARRTLTTAFNANN